MTDGIPEEDKRDCEGYPGCILEAHTGAEGRAPGSAGSCRAQEQGTEEEGRADTVGSSEETSARAQDSSNRISIFLKKSGSREILERMLELLPDEQHWCQQAYVRHSLAEGEAVRYCIAGAYASVVECEQDPMTLLAEGFHPALERVSTVIAEQFPEFAENISFMNRIFSFNDWQNRKFAEVRMVLEKAAQHE